MTTKTVSEILAPEKLDGLKPIQKTILKSGLIDKHMAQILERWGNLPPGSADLVNDDALKNATREQLTKLAEEIGEIVEDTKLKETALDLNALRWPVLIGRIFSSKGNSTTIIKTGITAVVDRMGRLYFRAQDVKEEWFVPGYYIEREVHGDQVRDQIREVSPLFVGDQVVAYQVSLL